MIIALVVNSGFKGRGVMRADDARPLGDPDGRRGADVEVDVQRHLRRHQRRAHPAAPHRRAASRGSRRRSTALASVAAVDIWKTTPFVALLLLAGLQVIPNEVYEAADVDGASKWHQFWRITLPLLVPAILVVAHLPDARRAARLRRLLRLLRLAPRHADDGDLRPRTPSSPSGDVGYGAAISVAIFLIIGIFVVIYTTFVRVQEQ